MFLVDKYSPSCIKESKFHNDLLERLNHMSKNESIPHILLCGPSGSGKKTIIKLLLEMMYDINVHKTEDTVYRVIGSGNKATEVVVKQSDYHIVIEPNNNNFDRYLIQDIVKEYAKKMPLGVFKTRKIFRTVLINNIDNLSYYAQTSLRRTMEKYSSTCRFIMWCTCSTRVIEPLVSRCIFFKLNAPSHQQLFSYINDISYKEKIKLTIEDFTYILDNARGNIKEALWLLELIKIGFGKKNIYYHTINLITSMIISHDIKQINIVLKDKNDKRLFLRDLLYNIMITNISGSKILKDITEKLCDNNDIPDECKYEIVRVMAYFEHNIIRGRRMIMHIEAPILKIMRILYNYEQEHPEYKPVFEKYYIEQEIEEEEIILKKPEKEQKTKPKKKKADEEIKKTIKVKTKNALEETEQKIVLKSVYMTNSK